MIPAIILCGGKGTRMGVDAPPKCLSVIDGLPIIARNIGHLTEQGISKFIICVGYKAEAVRNYFVGSQLDISFSNAGEEAGMLERIQRAIKNTSGRFLVCYGDEFADINLEKLIKVHELTQAYITMTCHKVDSPFGVVRISGERVTDFIEKPSSMVNIGYQVWESRKVERLISGQSLPSLLQGIAKIGRLAGYTHSGLRFTVNEPQDIAKAEAILAGK